VTATGVTALAAAAAHDRLGAILAPAAVNVDRAQAEAFQAPEGVWNSGADRVRLDVFALGALAYFVLAGRPPAPDRASLRERLQRVGVDAADRRLAAATARPTDPYQALHPARTPHQRRRSRMPPHGGRPA